MPETWRRMQVRLVLRSFLYNHSSIKINSEKGFKLTYILELLLAMSVIIIDHNAHRSTIIIDFFRGIKVVAFTWISTRYHSIYVVYIKYKFYIQKTSK